MHCQFGLIVTGTGEREFLPRLFRSLESRANCSFTVIRQIGQRNPITSPKKKLEMVGTGKVIPSKDEQEIGLPARGYLREKPGRCVVLVDDIERDRRPQLASIFDRYRTAVDTMLSPQERSRAGVHFFANMLEAYYFANNEAVNAALKVSVIPEDHPGDVEDIPHPKNELKAKHQGFDERTDGAAIVAKLNLDHVLSNPETCTFLRALIGWCVEKLPISCERYEPDLSSRYQLAQGKRAESGV